MGEAGEVAGAQRVGSSQRGCRAASSWAKRCRRERIALVGAMLVAMGAILRILDETSTGERLHELTIELRLVRERMTVRELITRRIRAEVRAHNATPVEIYRGLVQPAEAERVLNGYRFKEARQIDEDAQITKAMEAFQGNGFLLIVGDTQEDDLEAEVVLGEGVRVSFVKLVPLVGG